MMDRVIAMTAATQNDSPIDTGILLYRARALAMSGLPDAAIDVLTRALRRRKDRPEPLLHQIRYHRADHYELVGRRAQSAAFDAKHDSSHARSLSVSGVIRRVCTGLRHHALLKPQP